MYKLILFTTSWMLGTGSYVQLVREVAKKCSLDMTHYDSEVNASQSLVQIFSIKTSPTLVLVNDQSGEYKKFSMFHDESELIDWITKTKEEL